MATDSAVGVPVRWMAAEAETKGQKTMSNESEKLIKDAMDEMQSLGIDNLRAKGAIILLSEALRRAETARDAALKQSAGWEIQAQDMRDRLVRAEAERDAQHEQVLRLTGELEALAKDLDRMKAVSAIAGSVARWDSLLNEMHKQKAKVSELTATRDLLTAENARLQKERDAALAMEADTARRSSAEIDSLKAELNEARGEVEDLNRRVEEVCGQRDEARERLSEAMRRT